MLKNKAQIQERPVCMYNKKNKGLSEFNQEKYLHCKRKVNYTHINAGKLHFLLAKSQFKTFLTMEVQKSLYILSGYM